jgi:hypothetical protein
MDPRNIPGFPTLKPGPGLQCNGKLLPQDIRLEVPGTPSLGPTQPNIPWKPGALALRGVKLTTHLQPVPRSRKPGPIHPFPIRLHVVVLN